MCVPPWLHPGMNISLSLLQEANVGAWCGIGACALEPVHVFEWNLQSMMMLNQFRALSRSPVLLLCFVNDVIDKINCLGRRSLENGSFPLAMHRKRNRASVRSSTDQLQRTASGILRYRLKTKPCQVEVGQQTALFCFQTVRSLSRSFTALLRRNQLGNDDDGPKLHSGFVISPTHHISEAARRRHGFCSLRQRPIHARCVKTMHRAPVPWPLLIRTLETGGSLRGSPCMTMRRRRRLRLSSVGVANLGQRITRALG